MKVRRVAAGARIEPAPGELLLAPDRATAARLRARLPGAEVLLVADRLPFRDGALQAVVDERASRPESVAECVRVLATGGTVTLISDARGQGGLAFWKRAPRPLSATDASAWLLDAGCADLTQASPKEGVVVTEGVVRPRLA